MALHHASPGEVIDLTPLGASFESAKSSALIKSDRFEAIRLIVRAGSEIPQHEVAGNITLHCLEGHIQLGLGDVRIELKANQWIYLDGGAPHSLTGVEDSSLLLTILL